MTELEIVLTVAVLSGRKDTIIKLGEAQFRERASEYEKECVPRTLPHAVAELVSDAINDCEMIYGLIECTGWSIDDPEVSE